MVPGRAARERHRHRQRKSGNDGGAALNISTIIASSSTPNIASGSNLCCYLLCVSCERHFHEFLSRNSSVFPRTPGHIIVGVDSSHGMLLKIASMVRNAVTPGGQALQESSVVCVES